VYMGWANAIRDWSPRLTGLMDIFVIKDEKLCVFVNHINELRSEVAWITQRTP